MAGLCDSVLPQFAKLLSVAVTLNLAFLGIRYVARVRHLAQTKLEPFKQRGIDDLAELDVYAELQKLAGHRGTEGERLRNAPIRGLWGKVYGVLFNNRLAEVLSILLIGLSLAAIALGLAHETGYSCLGSYYFSSARIGIAFWIAITALAWPIFMIGAGVYTLQAVQHIIDRNVNQMLLFQRSAAATVTPLSEEAKPDDKPL